MGDNANRLIIYTNTDCLVYWDYVNKLLIFLFNSMPYIPWLVFVGKRYIAQHSTNGTEVSYN